jgi:hypothetical protein
MSEEEQMATVLERVQTAWKSGDPLALHREVEQLASQGYSRQVLEEALEALLREVRAEGADDDTEEIINGVWDRLTGWCHVSQHIATLPRKDDASGVKVPPVGSTPPSTVAGR